MKPCPFSAARRATGCAVRGLTVAEKADMMIHTDTILMENAVMRSRLLSLVLLLPATAAIADEVTLKSAQLNETLREAAQISGVLVTGVVGTGMPAATSPTLRVHLPQSWAGDEFCVSVLS